MKGRLLLVRLALRLRLARLTTVPAVKERTMQHDGSAEKFREGVRVLTELERTQRHIAMLGVLGSMNRAERRAADKRARRAAVNKKPRQ